MAKFAISGSFGEIARQLEGAETWNHDQRISFDIWDHIISLTLFEIPIFPFFTTPYFTAIAVVGHEIN